MVSGLNGVDGRPIPVADHAFHRIRMLTTATAIGF